MAHCTLYHTICPDIEELSTFWVLVTIGSVLIVGMVINNLVDYFERKAQLRVKLQQVNLVCLENK